MTDLPRLAAELARLAHDPRLPDWLARSASWIALDLLAEARHLAATHNGSPAANDNHHRHPTA